MLTKNRILIIHNPYAGGRDREKFMAIFDGLRNNQISIELIMTEYAGHGTELAKQYCTKKDIDMIVAAGGDGTINEVINGLYGSDMPLGIIPTGTVNVLAKEIGLKNTSTHIIDTIVRGNCQKIYIAKINERYFALMASVGLDALSVKNVNLTLKKYLGEFAYFISFVKQLIISKNTEYKVTIDGNDHICFGAIVSNGKYYAGKYICAPGSDIKDDKLYVVLMKNKGRFNLLRYFVSIITNRVATLDDIELYPAKSISISCAEAAPIQVDGDDFGDLPVQISISTKTISLVSPKP